MEFSPSDQRRNQCQFEAFAMKVICGERSDYFRELSAWSAKETTFSELPDVVLNNLASPDSDPSEQYVFQILGYYVPIQNDRLVESLLTFGNTEYTPLGRLLGENSPVLNEKSAKIQAFSPNNDRCKIMALYSKQVGGRPLNVAMERSTGPLLTVGTGRGSSPACFGFRGEKRSVEIWSERLHRSEGQKI